MEFKPTQEAELRRHQQRVDEWLDPSNRVNVLDNEMYLARVNPDGSDNSKLPTFDSFHNNDMEEYADKSLATVVEELNNSRTRHKEKVQVVDKNGHVVHRYKVFEADPTKTDDLFDTLATKLANSKLSDDGILNSLNQLNHRLSLTDDEISSLIDKIHYSREEAQNQADVETNRQNELEAIPVESVLENLVDTIEEPSSEPRDTQHSPAEDQSTKKEPEAKENPFLNAPDIMTRSFNQKEFDEANNNLNEAIKKGDKELFEKSIAFLRNEELAKFRITGSDSRDSFEKFVESKRKELEYEQKEVDTQDNNGDHKKPLVIIPLDEISNEDKEDPLDSFEKDLGLVPPIIVNDDDIKGDDTDDSAAAGTALPAPLPAPLPSEDKPTKEKKSLAKKAIAGLVIGAVAIGSFFVAKNALDDNSPNDGATTTEQTDNTTQAPGETVPLSDSELDKLDAFETQPEATPEQTEDTGEAKDSDADSQALKVAIYEKFGAQIDGQIDATHIRDLDASEIVVSGDVMPWNNVVNAGAENPDASIRANLVAYNQTHPENQFEYRDDGMFWSVSENRIINPDELKDYNELMKLIAEIL